ncbi:MAG: DUF1080 domain-containing protein [Verrucomicrobia bacterium]|nr:MAG: DUF1080 domain-containing protein [Verrucomicrobiota bacterium]TAE86156.1 MAG: DUF1080 domain-containing protein [Verrucomicrobiota bacterium]TAF23503.1 MAG: DUF1080 domain-containing protein [Verrucomicrobiota bacterium]TAF40131.1 MAG: DUF1080 domain-containing protein [Verrucomicrobiota bacterium]
MMKPFLVCALVLFPWLASASLEPLFNGRDLEGWRVAGAPCWSVVDGVLTGRSDAAKRNSILWTAKSYADFRVELEFRFSGDIDSGIFLRRENEQIQIGTSRSLGRDMSGSPYIASRGAYPVEAAGVSELLKRGEWNRMRIEARGQNYAVWLNGKRVVEYRSETAIESGPVGLQVHPGVEMKVEFRGLGIEAL